LGQFCYLALDRRRAAARDIEQIGGQAKVISGVAILAFGVNLGTRCFDLERRVVIAANLR
jgi:hypothetical protein